MRRHVSSIPLNRSFADALVTTLIERHGDGALGLARVTLILPSSRAVAAVQRAFVRQSEGGLVLPRMAAVGDETMADRVGLALEAATTGEPLPPVIDPAIRRLLLADMIRTNYHRNGQVIDDALAVHLAGSLARALDQLAMEEISLRELIAFDPGSELAGHWNHALEHLMLAAEEWPRVLEERGCIDSITRSARVLDAVREGWAKVPPAGPVYAAGVAVSSPAVARLLRAIASLPQGEVVLSGLDMTMPAEEWEALGDDIRATPEPELRRVGMEQHPQYHLKLLLARMGIQREEVQTWPGTSDWDGDDTRQKLVSRLFVPARFSAQWGQADRTARKPDRLRLATFPASGDEALGIALMLREALETPGRTAALVTPNRSLARRVSAALGRWGIRTDDSAGQPLGTTPPGALLRMLIELMAEGFSAVRMLAVLKHPLVRAGEGRVAWLLQVRALDRALRKPGRIETAADVAIFLKAETDARDDKDGDGAKANLSAWWDDVAAMLAPLLGFRRDGTHRFDAMLSALHGTLDRLCGDGVWGGLGGRALSDAYARWSEAAQAAPVQLSVSGLSAFIGDELATIAVRPPFGSHPRLSIWGVIESRTQHADLLIIGGLNEGGWPASPSPDPWLAPGVRRRLGLPSPDRNLGLAAHDFAKALASRDVVLTRAEREDGQPAIASRFWLRLQATTGTLPQSDAWADLAARVDVPDGPVQPAPRPSPNPPVAWRPRTISVTQIDKLASDPFAFYAEKVLHLRELDPIAGTVSVQARGTRMHAALETWAKDAVPTPLRMERIIADLEQEPAFDTVTRKLWLPRVVPALRWIAEDAATARGEGMRIAAVETPGTMDFHGFTITGKADRIDRHADGTLSIIDYKTGEPPEAKDIDNGRACQLAMLAMMADRGALNGIAASTVTGLRYISLQRSKEGKEPVTVREIGSGQSSAKAVYNKAPVDAFIARAEDEVRERLDYYLNNETPFAPDTEAAMGRRQTLQQLMRLEEWYGRERSTAAASESDAPPTSTGAR